MNKVICFILLAILYSCQNPTTVADKSKILGLLLPSDSAFKNLKPILIPRNAEIYLSGKNKDLFELQKSMDTTYVSTNILQLREEPDSISLRNVVYLDYLLDMLYFNNNATYNGIIVNTALDFNNVLINGPVFYINNTFKKTITFESTIFQKGSSFSYCNFIKNTSFAYSRFMADSSKSALSALGGGKESAGFQSAKFKGIVIFNHVKFYEKVNFERAIFNNYSLELLQR